MSGLRQATLSPTVASATYVPGLIASGAGIDPTGVADSTTALQAKLDAISATGGVLYIPAGTYKITAALLVRPAANSAIVVQGAGRPGRNLTGMFTYIRQDGGNLPVFKFTTNGLTASTFSDFGVGYTNPSGAGNTAQIGFQFDEPSAGAGSTWFANTFVRLAVFNAYIAFGLVAPSAQAALWLNEWDQILIDNVQHSAFSLHPGTAIGQPINTFRNIRVNNANGAVVSDGLCFDFAGVEAHFSGIDVEGWYNQILQCGGGYSTDIEGLHVEHHHIDGVTSSGYVLLEVAGGCLNVRNASFAGSSLGGAFGITAMGNSQNAGDLVTLDDITMAWASVTGALDVVFGGSGSYRVGNVIQAGGSVAPSVPSTDAGTNQRTDYLLAAKGHLTAPGVPATTVAFTHTFSQPCAVTIVAGTSTVAVAIGGTTAMTIPANDAGRTFIVPRGVSVTLTYTNAPTWVWVGL